MYDEVKNTILHVYDLVPEAYRQRFRNLKKTSNQSYVDFAREKEVLFTVGAWLARPTARAQCVNSCWWWSSRIVLQNEP